MYIVNPLSFLSLGKKGGGSYFLLLHIHSLTPVFPSIQAKREVRQIHIYIDIIKYIHIVTLPPRATHTHKHHVPLTTLIYHHIIMCFILTMKEKTKRDKRKIKNPFWFAFIFSKYDTHTNFIVLIVIITCCYS